MFVSQYKKRTATSHKEVYSSARNEYHRIERRNSRRMPYVRSAYFKKEKVFINIFWEHVKQKNYGEQAERLKYYNPAIDLIVNAGQRDLVASHQIEVNVLLYRFEGKTQDGYIYFVQLKQNLRTGRKDFMSVFPAKQSRK